MNSQSWQHIQHRRVNLDGQALTLDGQPLSVAELFDETPDLEAAVRAYQHSQTDAEPLKPQLALVVYDVTGKPEALKH